MGSLLIDPDAIVLVADLLRPGDFYRDAHRTIYEAILRLHEQRRSADFITLCDELEQHGRLEDVGGASYLTSLVNLVPTSWNAEQALEQAEALTDYLHDLDHRHGQDGAVMGVPTSFRDLDGALGGLQRSDLIILVARPGQGKTSGYRAAQDGAEARSAGFM
ncbi:MAG TPA: DnaB-like helicase N-terminal domain-containing protein [Ktedonosporobacter sp.]|nr:DnaB-like helicase N-terminal domain-containing protein [Ktedonosporobacter sp.]